MKKMRREAQVIQGQPPLQATGAISPDQLSRLQTIFSTAQPAVSLLVSQGQDILHSILDASSDGSGRCWVKALLLDCLLFLGRFQEAINLATAFRKQLDEAEQAAEKEKAKADEHTRLRLQISSALLGLNRIAEAAAAALDALAGATEGGAGASVSAGEVSSAALVFVAAESGSTLGFAHRLVLNALAPKLLCAGKFEDEAGGAGLVLSQLEWPRYEWLLEAVLGRVVSRKKLVCRWVLGELECVELLEELAYLAATEEELELSLSGEDGVVSRKSSHGTRTAVRGAREELRTALEARMSLPNLAKNLTARVATFLVTHKDRILQML